MSPEYTGTDVCLFMLFMYVCTECLLYYEHLLSFVLSRYICC